MTTSLHKRRWSLGPLAHQASAADLDLLIDTVPWLAAFDPDALGGDAAQVFGAQDVASGKNSPWTHVADANTPNVAPSGSRRTAARPVPGMSTGGTRTSPPCSLVCAAAASTSSVWK